MFQADARQASQQLRNEASTWGVSIRALGLMSINEEWEGWSDALPLVLLYLVSTAIVWVIMWILVRTGGDS